MDIRLGRHVVCRDGASMGRVDRLVLDPDSHTLLALIVHRGLLLSADRIVEQRHVTHVDGDGSIHLDVTAAEADALPVFFEHEFVTPARGDLERVPYAVSGGIGAGAAMTQILWGTPQTSALATPATRSLFQLASIQASTVELRSNVPDDSVTISHGTAVIDATGKQFGVVDDVDSDATGVLCEIIARTGHLHHERVHIPIAFVEGIAHDHIRLNVTQDDLPVSVIQQ
jgi:uncharacterized protein YrrD